MIKHDIEYVLFMKKTSVEQLEYGWAIEFDEAAQYLSFLPCAFSRVPLGVPFLFSLMVVGGSR